MVIQPYNEDNEINLEWGPTVLSCLKKVLNVKMHIKAHSSCCIRPNCGFMWLIWFSVYNALAPPYETNIWLSWKDQCNSVKYMLQVVKKRLSDIYVYPNKYTKHPDLLQVYIFAFWYFLWLLSGWNFNFLSLIVLKEKNIELFLILQS